MSRSSNSVLRRFIESEASSGVVLMAGALLALMLANSPFRADYFALLHLSLGGLDIRHAINDGLMAVFFLLVGLDIKREILAGQLSTWSSRILPGLAALGGMVVPALVYLAFNAGSVERLDGWAIPAATDIAFALGVLTLLRSRVPLSLKIFLTALAIIDDLGAILIIALFYTADLDVVALTGAATVTLLLVGLNRLNVRTLLPYLVLGAGLWWLVFVSGIHATLAGVILAMTIPLSLEPQETDAAEPPLLRLEQAIHPLVAFLIVPVFGFANAGVSFAGFSAGSLIDPVPLGVAAGLFLGKQIGVFGAVALAVKTKIAAIPEHATWRHVYGVSLLCGIGFTMSLFLGPLAFPDAPALQDEVKLGVLMGSILSGAAGALVLASAPPKRRTFQPKKNRNPEGQRS